MKKILPVLSLIVLSGLLIVACPNPSVSSPSEGTFWTIDITLSPDDPDYYYQVDAKRIYAGNYCEIWDASGQDISKGKAKEIADEYDTRILDLILDNFGTEGNFTFRGTNFKNVMELANWLVTGKKSGKFLILLLDIKDGITSADDAYTAGYFGAENYFEGAHSNLRNMIYLDTYPGLSNPEQMYETLAHEMQHLASFMAALATRSTVNEEGNLVISQLDLWIDEGMSTMAESIYQDGREGQTGRFFWFNEDKENTISRGNNFYVWGNIPPSMLDEYATVYMFFQWLQIQLDGDTFLFKKISSSEYSDDQAVTELAKLKYSEWANWETLLCDWLIANYINAPTGKYGYKGDFVVGNRNPIDKYDEAYEWLNLYPGEGVYSKIDDEVGSYTIPADSGKNIKYYGLEKGTEESAGSVNPASGSVCTGDALFSFNANMEKKDTDGNDTEPELAYLTGIKFPPPPIPPNIPEEGSFIYRGSQQVNKKRPYVIDIRDIIGRQEISPKIELPELECDDKE